MPTARTATISGKRRVRGFDAGKVQLRHIMVGVIREDSPAKARRHPRGA